MYIHIYNNKAIHIDGHIPIRYTCGALPTLLFLMPMLHFVSGFDHSLSVS